jgi:hypothetical protein
MYEKKKKMAIVNKSKFQFSSEPTKLPPAISAECVAQPLYSKSSRQPVHLVSAQVSFQWAGEK